MSDERRFELNEMSYAELKQIAMSYNIRGNAKFNEMVDAILAIEQGVQPEASVMRGGRVKQAFTAIKENENAITQSSLVVLCIISFFIGKSMCPSSGSISGVPTNSTTPLGLVIN